MERLRGVRLLQALMLAQSARIIGLVFISSPNQGFFPLTFAIPAALGGFLVAVTGPLVVLGLRRGGPVAWAVAIAWNALGLAELAYAAVLSLLAGGGVLFTFPWLLLPAIGLPVFTALHAASLALLFRRPVRRYFAERGLQETPS